MRDRRGRRPPLPPLAPQRWCRSATPQVETEFELLHPNLEYYRPAKVEEVAKILNGGR
ncbi:hypothetical protein SHIRM173S_07246 [Streptomyces hirsutus]